MALTIAAAKGDTETMEEKSLERLQEIGRIVLDMECVKHPGDFPCDLHCDNDDDPYEMSIDKAFETVHLVVTTVRDIVDDWEKS